MVEIRKVSSKEKKLIDEIVSIHLETFTGFFLTSLGRGFLNQLYKSYCEYADSGLFVAVVENEPVGFLAYSGDYSGLYKYMIKKRMIPFAWYSFWAFVKNPKILFRILGAFSKSDEVKREEKYLELASIGVSPRKKSNGIGSQLIEALIKVTDFSKYAYISLETDVDNNEIANAFYIKNGFVLSRTFVTKEGRKMNEYHYSR